MALMGMTVAPVNMLSARVNFEPATAGNNTLVAGVAAQTIRVYRLILTLSASSDLEVRDGTTTVLADLYARTGVTLDLVPQDKEWFLTTAGNGLILNSSAAVNIGGRIWYAQD